jgi:Tol biopolymer transport system component
MGQVFRARDTTLNRDVAIKVLPDVLARDPERLARLNREAQTLASLNHPNIAQIYGLHDTTIDGEPRMRAIVMELVEGEDLSQRITRGPVPIDEALHIARQMAEALEAAHEQGIVHRDLKPANVKLRPDGTVKVLDFGLAKALASPSEEAVGLSQSPTITSPAMTQAGIILGTAAYMSPEQARGRVVDKRADIWAFGVVMLEMLTGRSAFVSDDISTTLAAVLMKEPDWKAVPSTVPASLRRLLRRCEKDPRRSRGSDAGGAAHTAAPVGVDDRSHGLGDGRAACMGAEANAASRHAVPPCGADVSGRRRSRAWRLSVRPCAGRSAPGLPSRGEGRHDEAVVAFARCRRSRALFGTENAESPFWSPDSLWVAFAANGRLLKISVTGGQPQVICNAGSVRGGTWNREGVILFADGASGIIQRVSDAGGSPSIAIGFDKALNETGQLAPEFLPDGRHFLYSSNGKERGLAVMASLDGLSRRVLFTTNNSPAIYASNPAGGGWILSVNRQQLLARAFDPVAGALIGDAALVVDGIPNGPSWSTSTSGSLLYSSAETEEVQLTWVSRDGTPLGTIGEPGTIGPRSISTDGRTVAFTRTEQENTDIYIWDPARGGANRLTSEPGLDTAPLCTPDGQILYYSRRGEGAAVVERSASGLAAERVVMSAPSDRGASPSSITRDGRLFAIGQGGGGTSDMALVSRRDGNALFVERGGSPAISPDGRWLAYVVGAAGGVFVRALHPDGRLAAASSRRQISASGAILPRWRADGREPFYVELPERRMMAVSVESTDGSIRLGAPRPLFKLPGAQIDYAVTTDGQRFLISQPVANVGVRPMLLVTNWPQLLQR